MKGSAPRLWRTGAVGKWSGMLAVLLAIHPVPVIAQGAAAWVEATRTTVTAAVAGGSHERTITREAHYRSSLRGDTLVLHVEALDLTEVADGETRAWDTDGFVGGFWKLLREGDRWRVVERPFVPPALATVSDLARIGEDFFPPTPPAVAAGSTVTAADARRWTRDPDLDGARHYRWSLQRTSDTTEVVADSTVVHRTERLREEGDGRWDAAGPVGWTRRLEEETEGRFLGRTVRAMAITTVAVRRETIDDRR